MARYEVVKPWHGVAVGDVVDMDTLHPALQPHLRLIKGEAAGELTPATPAAASGRGRKPKQEE
ncbi:glycoprotein [Enterobacter sp. Ap-916]|uniref:glycoprotein n=1 Tax=unclassified Enterobacter TaxID=2608935 RepID=UPI00141EFDDF|nr:MULTISPECIES: glycoprotein [unclassified Enterobacter]NIF57532.1 glycoprotein [Enterobacter sp. Ap-867]NIG28525.1 glycoprotein [Enterobacter sp. Ap-916]